MRVAVSALILVFLASVGASVLLYTYVAGLIGSLTTNSSSFPSAKLVLISVRIDDACITVKVKNTGGVEALTIAYAYVDNVPYSLNPNVQVPPDSTATVHVNGMYTRGNTYAVKLVCTNGYTVTFDVTY